MCPRVGDGLSQGLWKAGKLAESALTRQFEVAAAGFCFQQASCRNMTQQCSCHTRGLAANHSPLPQCCVSLPPELAWDLTCKCCQSSGGLRILHCRPPLSSSSLLQGKVWQLLRKGTKVTLNFDESLWISLLWLLSLCPSRRKTKTV